MFHDEYEAARLCRALETEGFRPTELASQVLHRSYSVQTWTDGANDRRWRVEWHAHVSSSH